MVVGTQSTQVRSGSLATVSVRRAGPFPLTAWICLLIVYVVWGSTYLAIRVGVETMPPLLMAAARSLVAGLIMFPLGLRRRRSAPLASRWPSRAQWRWCAAAGVLLLVG
jgi:drug/metabolite transporter (DMT)-like permease